MKQPVWRGVRCRGQSRALSSRRPDKIGASLQLRGLLAELQTYSLDLQGICACSAAMSFAFYC